MVKTSLKQW